MCTENLDAWIIPTGTGAAAAHGCCGGPRRNPGAAVTARIIPLPHRPPACAGSCQEEPVPDERPESLA